MTGIDIPGFTLIEKVGAGGMATVWKARQNSLDREVAIKILYSKFASDPGDVQRFQSEAQAAARLKHPGIVQVYDANALNGMYYFVMEYVAGYTVGEWIKRKGTLSAKDALLVAECVADALHYAWREAGIMHCDVKPDNVLVDADGTVKVADLGLARTLSQMLLESAGEDIMGTPAYIAPEQALGDADLDFRVDIYALGASLYHMVTGVVPFAGEDPETVMDLQISGTIPDPVEVNPTVPAPVAWLIEKMMCKDPEGRQATWDEVCKDIDRVKKGLRPQGTALPEGVSTVARSPARLKAASPVPELWRRPRRGLVRQLVNLGLIVLLAGAAWATYLYWKAEHAGAPAQARPAGAPTTGTGAGLRGQPSGSAPAEAQTTRWEREYHHELAWITANPGRFDEGVARLQRVVREGVGTPYAEMARIRVEAMQRERHQQIEAVLSELNRVAQPMLAENRFRDAARIYAEYSGALAAETRERREAKARECEARLRDSQSSTAVSSAAPPAGAERWRRTLDAVAEDLLAQRWSAALDRVQEAQDEGPVASNMEAVWPDLMATLQAASDAQQRLVASLVDQRGQPVTVLLRNGARDLNIQDVRDDRIVATLVNADPMTGGTIEFDLRFLSFRERIRRMAPIESPGAPLVRGLLALEAGDAAAARRYLAECPAPLAERLLAALAE